MRCRNLFVGIVLSGLSVTSFAGTNVFVDSYKAQANGNLKKAADILSPMISKNNEYALMRYAYLQYLQGQYNESIESYKRLIQSNPKSIDAKLGITLPYLAQKRWRQVKQYSLEVLKLSHWNYVAHVRLMIAEEGMKNWETLQSHASQLSKVYPTDVATLVYLARAYAWQGNKDSAKSIYRKVLNRSPAHIEANYYVNAN